MGWKVRFIDYPEQFRQLESEIMDTIRTVLSNGDLILRQQLKDFEADLAAFVGTNYAVGVSNCTDGMRLALLAAGVGPGDEVITVSHTFVATVAAIHHTGATPVLVDIGDDHNLNVKLVEAAITGRTKVIMPVHLNGRLCDMVKLMPMADRHGLLIIEDAAQALGGSIDRRKAGSWGLAGCFSFYPAKLLGGFGDAGAVVTNSQEIAIKIRLLRNHGRMDDGDVAGWSFNCRLDNLHAAILAVKLKHLPAWIARRRDIARFYHERLSGMTQLRLPPTPATKSPYWDVFQNYEMEATDRDNLVEYLRKKSIEIMIPWGGRGVHQFKSLGLTQASLPQTEQMFQRVVMLPIYPELTDRHVEYVTDSIRDCYAH